MAHGIDPGIRRLIDSVEAWPAAMVASYAAPPPPPPVAAPHRAMRPKAYSSSIMAPASRKLPTLASLVPQRPDEPYFNYRGSGVGPMVGPGSYDGLNSPVGGGSRRASFDRKGFCTEPWRESPSFSSGVPRMPQAFGQGRGRSAAADSLYAAADIPQHQTAAHRIDSRADVAFRSVVARDAATDLQRTLMAARQRRGKSPGRVPSWHDAEGPTGPFANRDEHARVLAAARATGNNRQV